MDQLQAVEVRESIRVDILTLPISNKNQNYRIQKNAPFIFRFADIHIYCKGSQFVRNVHLGPLQRTLTPYANDIN